MQRRLIKAEGDIILVILFSAGRIFSKESEKWNIWAMSGISETQVYYLLLVLGLLSLVVTICKRLGRCSEEHDRRCNTNQGHERFCLLCSVMPIRFQCTKHKMKTLGSTSQLSLFWRKSAADVLPHIIVFIVIVIVARNRIQAITYRLPQSLITCDNIELSICCSLLHFLFRDKS